MTNRAMLSLVDGEIAAGQGARLRLLLAAKLVLTTGELAVMLRELSATNAIVTGERLPGIGTDAILKRGRLEALGTILWAEGTRACLEFEDPLHEADLLSQMTPDASPADLLPRSFS